jgi:hypothetical protein
MGGTPSGPYALFTFNLDRTWKVLREENIGRGIDSVEGKVGAGGASESSKVELEENREPNRVAFS